MNFRWMVATAAMAAWSTAVFAAADPVRGDGLYHFTYRCNECHANKPTASTDIVVLGGATSMGILSSIQTVTEMRQRYASTLGRNQADLDDLAAYLASFLAAPAPVEVVEYHHAAFDHYFVTGLTDEIGKLDSGAFPGWTRTGYTFKAYATAATGASTVCRFFSTSFAPKSSHFYTPFAAECALVKASPDWQYEGDVMYIPVAAADGTCLAGTVPVYRLYNNGQGGAPNHRYVADAAQRDQMLANSWTLEGNGPGFAFMCAPAS